MVDAKKIGSNSLNKILRERKAQFLADLEAGDSGWTVVTGNEAGGKPIIL